MKTSSSTTTVLVALLLATLATLSCLVATVGGQENWKNRQVGGSHYRSHDCHNSHD